MTLANEFLPSAMGLTALVEVPDRLRVDVSAGVYEHDELQVAAAQDKDGKEFFPKAWWRQPVDRSVELASAELLGAGTVVVKKTSWKKTGSLALELHVVSRPDAKSLRPDAERLITFTLVNRRFREGKTPDNSDCFFQCGFSVLGVDGGAAFPSLSRAVSRPRGSGRAVASASSTCTGRPSL